MSARHFCIPGLFFLFCAFVLSLIVSISLPSLPALDIARTKFSGGTTQVSNVDGGVNELRFGVWAYCAYVNGDRSCIDRGHGYSVDVSSNSHTEDITGGWTRGLAVHPAATIVTFLALLAGCSTHITLMLLASILSFLAAIITLIAFAIDIALFVNVHNSLNNFDNLRVDTDTGPGFWITFVTLLLLLVSGCTVCFGRRRERMSGATATTYPEKPGLLSRFRRRRGAAV
ncbi:unnamed protein product [Peniophora sp. CBMAI 1063]|nr:unnamed protein product [Peniophora sp. CBMAI 1063]